MDVEVKMSFKAYGRTMLGGPTSSVHLKIDTDGLDDSYDQERYFQIVNEVTESAQKISGWLGMGPVPVEVEGESGDPTKPFHKEEDR
jgi:hypothetical protein